MVCPQVRAWNQAATQECAHRLLVPAAKSLAARFDAGVDSRERGIERQLSPAAKSLASVPESKKEQLKALTMPFKRLAEATRLAVPPA